jgi:chemotaxis protein histidine kinase CheA
MLVDTTFESIAALHDSLNELKTLVKSIAETQQRNEEARQHAEARMDARIDQLVLVQQGTQQAIKELTEAQQRTEARVEQLTEAQQRTEARVEQLTEAQQRTEARVEQLTEAQQRTELAQQRTEARMEQLAEAQQRTELAQQRTEARVEQLTEAQQRTELAQQRTEMAIQELKEAQQETSRQIEKLTHSLDETRRDVGGIGLSVGYMLENEAYRWLPAFLQEQHGITITRRLIRVEMGGLEINVFGEGTYNGKPITLVGEAKNRLELRRRRRGEDVFDEIEKKLQAVRAELGEREYMPVLVTNYATEAFLAEAQQRNVLVVQSFEW